MCFQAPQERGFEAPAETLCLQFRACGFLRNSSGFVPVPRCLCREQPVRLVPRGGDVLPFIGKEEAANAAEDAR